MPREPLRPDGALSVSVGELIASIRPLPNEPSTRFLPRNSCTSHGMAEELRAQLSALGVERQAEDRCGRDPGTAC